MAINKKLIHFKEKADFVNEVANNNILYHSIVFIQDSKEISTHGTVYKTVNWSVLKRKLDYMKVVALEDGLTVSFTNPLEYSFDETTWQSLPANTGTPAINKDQYVAFRAKLTPVTYSGIGTFSINKQCDLKGNCMSLLFGDDFSDKVDLTGYSYAFSKLFYNQSNIKSVNPGFLPATTLANSCYQDMFNACKSLTTAPELPAATLASSCYFGMLVSCYSLTIAPELPATTLASNCYGNMFSDCTGLTTAPKLPATTLADSCYKSMFYNCRSLTTASELPATTLAYYCYQDMFYNCRSLTTAPKLPATTLAGYCYQRMFSSCYDLTTAPELPATTLAVRCYDEMFYNCSKLNYIKALFTTTPGTSCTNDWVKNVSSTGTFVKSKDATWDVTGVDGVPENWTVEVA